MVEKPNSITFKIAKIFEHKKRTQTQFVDRKQPSFKSTIKKKRSSSSLLDPSFYPKKKNTIKASKNEKHRKMKEVSNKHHLNINCSKV